MVKENYLGHAKPGSRMLKRGWLINMMPIRPKPVEEKPAKKKGEQKETR